MAHPLLPEYRFPCAANVMAAVLVTAFRALNQSETVKFPAPGSSAVAEALGIVKAR
jgi:hypothetical protein